MAPEEISSRQSFIKRLGRGFLLLGFSALAKSTGAGSRSEALATSGAEKQGKSKMPDKILKTEEEWEKMLNPEQFNLLRKKGTERAIKGQ